MRFRYPMPGGDRDDGQERLSGDVVDEIAGKEHPGVKDRGQRGDRNQVAPLPPFPPSTPLLKRARVWATLGVVAALGAAEGSAIAEHSDPSALGVAALAVLLYVLRDIDLSRTKSVKGAGFEIQLEAAQRARVEEAAAAAARTPSARDLRRMALDSTYGHPGGVETRGDAIADGPGPDPAVIAAATEQSRRRAVEELIEASVAWGWTQAKSNVWMAQPKPVVRWSEDGTPSIMYGTTAGTGLHDVVPITDTVHLGGESGMRIG